VILDVKRGDIGTTAQAYADAYLDPTSPLASDAITASPYLGFGSLEPMIDTARRHGGGVFALALTSNPEAPRFQHARTADGTTIAGEVLAGLRAPTRGPTRSAPSVRWSERRSASTDEDLAINGPLLARASAPRAAPPTTYAASSAPRSATSYRPRRARSSAPVLRSRRCVTRPPGPTTSSRRWSADAVRADGGRARRPRALRLPVGRMRGRPCRLLLRERREACPGARVA
jgi:hypothetical protein